VHFAGQGVVDERPFQEAAAKALGIDLTLMTLDGATFPEDLLRLSYFQDAPVIGAAMVPMYHVSRLAAANVKVCLGGQGGDELFGGYARYALAGLSRTAAQWIRGARAGSTPDRQDAAVGGNLAAQGLERRNLRRLAANVLAHRNWRDRYFANFATVPPATWDRVFEGARVHDRRAARATFDDVLDRSPARDPGSKLIHWDAQTYLPGLFHQDDRMSMANSLESRVPLADPRLLRFALQTPFGLKIRDGASKWILRRAVAGVLPANVLNRRKVGFDTPAERWMRTTHAGFVRDLLLSARARQRGYWNPRYVEQLLDPGRGECRFDVMWKLVSIEAWATTFIDGNFPAGAPRLTHAA
jgi:asparagine synthase (glutamine-hydrolysing)